MPKSFNNYVSNLPALNLQLLYDKKQCNSFNEIRCEEAMKKVTLKRYHRTENSLTLHVMSCCDQLHVLTLKTAEFGYEFYKEAHGRMALGPLMMSQSTTLHKS